MTDDETPAAVAWTELWDWSDPAASEQRFRDIAMESRGERRLVALTQVARALGLQKRYADGREVLAEVAGSPDGMTPEVSTGCALEYGRLLRSEGREAEAAPLFEQAATEAGAAGLEALHVDALHNAGSAGRPGRTARADPAGARRRPSGHVTGGATLGRVDEARTMQRALKVELDAVGEEDTYVDQELALLAGDDPA